MDEKYAVEFAPGWREYFDKLDTSVQARVFKKIRQLETGFPGRHLKHGLDFFVEEVGGFRIAYKSDEALKIRKIYFAGSHKDYEKWYKSQT